MAQLDFYADSSDLLEVIDYMFDISEMRLFEAYSRPDCEIREFKSSKDILASSHIADNHGGIFVRGWWTSVTTMAYVKKFDLKTSLGNHRSSLEGVGTFQLIQGRSKDLDGSPLDCCSFTHWNEKGALQGSNEPDADILKVNWKEFRRLSNKLHRHVRNNMSQAKLFKLPVLVGAHEILESGGNLFGRGNTYSIESEEIVHNKAFKSDS